jgi:hypothetical protein
MTIHSTSYDALVSLIKVTLPTFYRLTNPNDTSQNFDLFLREGWSLIAESSANTDRNLCKINSYRRNYVLTISVEVFGTESDEISYDDSIKKLLEAVSSVVIAIENDQYLGIAGGNAIAAIVGDSGIIPITSGNKKIVMSELTISLETFIGY